VREWFSPGSSFGVDPEGWDELGQAVAESHQPPGVVEQAVVDLAQHDAVVQGGFAAVFPWPDVVDLAPGRRSSAARVGAAAVAGGHGAAQAVGDGAGDPADVEGLAVAIQDDGDHGGVAGFRG